MRPATFLKSLSGPGRAQTFSKAAAEELAPVVAAVRIEAPDTVRYGDLDAVTIRAAEIAAAVNSGSHPLVGALTSLIYHFAYARAHTASPQDIVRNAGEALGNIEPDTDFLAVLSAANRSRERWDPLWRVYQIGPGGLLSIEKRSTYRQATPGLYTFTDAPGRGPAVGDTVAIHAPKESSTVQPGFYFAFGETVASDFDDVQLARFYFNLAPGEVPGLLEWISTDLNRYRIPYRFKCLLQPALYDRRDPVVLYVAKRFVPAFLRLGGARKNSLEEKLRDGIPLFTKRMLRGLGAADEPGGGSSFGQSRTGWSRKESSPHGWRETRGWRPARADRRTVSCQRSIGQRSALIGRRPGSVRMAIAKLT